jgi:hypothetical protein
MPVAAPGRGVPLGRQQRRILMYIGIGTLLLIIILIVLLT